MKVSIKKEMLFSVLVLLPYVENNMTQLLFQCYFENSYIRAITVISFIVITFIIIGMAYHLVNKHDALKFSIDKSIMFLLLFIIYTTLANVFISKDLLLSFCVWVWVNTPIIFALIVVSFYRLYSLKIKLIIKYGIYWFVLYLSVVLLYYILVYGLFIDETVRMDPRGGGAVIFGYTIALFFSLTLIYKKLFNTVCYYLILIVLTIGAIGTTTRGSVWLIFLLWISNFLFTNFNNKRIVFFVMLIPITYIISIIDFNSISTESFVGIERLLNFNSYRRVTSTINIIDIFSELNINKKCFGFGLGGFFPYQSWAMHVDDVENNLFSYLGRSLLVQPHNSFLYMLMECGITGVALIVLSFLSGVKQCVCNKKERWIYKIVFLGSFVLLNCLDSIFFVQPGTAYLFWLIYFMVLMDDKHKLDGEL